MIQKAPYKYCHYVVDILSPAAAGLVISCICALLSAYKNGTKIPIFSCNKRISKDTVEIQKVNIHKYQCILIIERLLTAPEMPQWYQYIVLSRSFARITLLTRSEHYALNIKALVNIGDKVKSKQTLVNKCL